MAGPTPDVLDNQLGLCGYGLAVPCPKSHPDLFCVHNATNHWSIMTGSLVDYDGAPKGVRIGLFAAGGDDGNRAQGGRRCSWAVPPEVPALRAAFPSLGLAVVCASPMPACGAPLPCGIGWDGIARASGTGRPGRTPLG